MNKICLALGILTLIACASTPTTDGKQFSLSKESYEKTIDSYSDEAQKYDGPYNLMVVSATILNTPVLEAQARRQATMFQWDQTKYQSELTKKFSQSQSQTEVFVSFFTPDRRSGDLMRSETLWKVILRVNNREYVGKAKKLTLLPVEIASIYPKHEAWNAGYLITFDSPVPEVDSQSSELLITGPIGSATLKFPPASRPSVE